MVGQLLNDEADICLSALALTSDRAQAIDFTLSLVTSPVTITGLKPGNNIKGGYKAFLKVFTYTTWIGLGIMALALGISTSIVLGNTNLKIYWKTFQLGVIHFGLSCLQLGNIISGKLNAWKILQLTIALCGYLIFTAYTSDLTAILTVGQPGRLPRNFKEIISDGYRILAAKGAWPAVNMKNKPPGSFMRKAFDNHTTLYQYDGDMDSIVHKMSADPKLLYYGDSMHFSKHRNLEAVSDLEEIYKFLLPIGLQKDSELRIMLNHHILKMKQSGLLSKLFRKWMQDDSPGDWSERIFEEQATSIGYSNVLLPVLILVGGSLTSILLACLEKLKSYMFNIDFNAN